MLSCTFDLKTVTVKDEMQSPGETHDKCNAKELNVELSCDVINGFLTCRPEKCGLSDRFRCDCTVHIHG